MGWRRPLEFLDAHGWVAVVLCCFVAIGVSKYLSDQARHDALQETCHFIDAEHDRVRAQYVEDLGRLFRPPYTGTFKLSPTASHKAYIDTKHRYVHVIDTRPGYCDARERPVAPFPAEHAINPAA